MLLAFLRSAAQGLKTDQSGRRLDARSFSSLFWVAREERGEHGGRVHFHILISGLPLTRHNLVEANVMCHIWKKLGGGFADARMYDAGMNAANYVVKGLEEWSYEHANAYELGKFAHDPDRELIFAYPLLEKWERDAKRRKVPFISRCDKSQGRPSNRCEPVGRKRAKESIEETLRGGYGYNMHPAGLSFVR